MLTISLKLVLPIVVIFSTSTKATKDLRKTNKVLMMRDMLQTRIVGGTQAQRGAYPYFTQWIGGCGASLIHEDILLSAAHCNEIFETDVIVGAYEDGKVGNGALARTIVGHAIHPKFSPYARANDYLVLKLNSPVTTIKPITLNRSNASPVSGKDLVVIGLGHLAEYGESPQFLNEVTVQAVNQTTCNQEYNGEIVEASMMCAAVAGGGKDSCQGDSGGPLVQIVNGEHIQVGIVSWGEGCARPFKSGVYSRVSGEIAWIEQQVCLMSSKPPSRCANLIPATLAPGSSNTKPPTAKPSTAKPSTAKPSTAKPSTAKPSTANPPTAKPSTAKPATNPVTYMPIIKPVTYKPTTKPTGKPTTTPTRKPTTESTTKPINVSTAKPTTRTTTKPTTTKPSNKPTAKFTLRPTKKVIHKQTMYPSQSQHQAL